MELQRYLLLALSIAALFASLPLLASAKPLSRREPAGQLRTDSTTETSETHEQTTGNIAERTVRDTTDQGTASGGADNCSTSNGETATTTVRQSCMETCYHRQVPKEDIMKLRQRNFDQGVVHPSFALAEWLESYHRELFCSGWSVGQSCEVFPAQQATSEDTQLQATNDTVTLMKDTIYSNFGLTVEFNDTYYPRYFVPLPCHSNSADKMKYLLYSEGRWNIKDTYGGCEVDV